MHHRSFARLGTTLVALAIILIGCAPAAPTTPSNTGSTSQGGTATTNTKPSKTTLVIGLATITPTMMPYISICCTQRRYDVFDTLVGQKDDGSVEPSAATSWKTTNPTTWEFTVRSDMVFHDGVKMTADDVAFSVNRARDPDKKYAILSRVQTIVKAEAVNATTVRVTTKEPDPLMLKRAAMISILPKAYLEKVGDDEFSLHPIGTGPFKVKDWVPDDHVTVVATESHPFRKSKSLTQVTIKNVAESSARIAGLKSGDLDMINTVQIDQSDGLKAAGFQLIPITAGSSAGYWVDTVIGDQPRNTPTANKLVRQAMNYAVNKELIAKNVYKGLTAPEMGQPIQKETFGFDPSLKPYPYDPAKAKQLLAQAGYPNGFDATIGGLFASNAEAQATVLVVQDQFKQVGINLKIQEFGEYATFRDYFYGAKTRPDLMPVGLLNRPAMDADYALVWFWSGQNPGARHYNNPAFDKAYEASRIEMDEKKRLADFQEALKVFHEDPPYLFLVDSLALLAANPNLQGVTKRTDLEPRYDLMSWK